MKYNLSLDESACIDDKLNDLDALNKVRLSFVHSDAMPKVRQPSHHVLKGEQNAGREAANFALGQQ